jgi:uncharacterized protein (TIGR02594 family)
MKLGNKRVFVFVLCSTALSVIGPASYARPLRHHNDAASMAARATSIDANPESDRRYEFLESQAPESHGQAAHSHGAAQAYAAVEPNEATPAAGGRHLTRRSARIAAQSYAAVEPGEAMPADGQRPVASRAARIAAQSHSNSAYGGYSGNDLVSEARRYIGTNPTGRGSLWCGAFMDFVLRHTGHQGGGNLAMSYAHYGTRITGPQVGAIAVMGRHGGGHVGVVSGIDPNGNPIIVSGNHNRTVDEAVYPRGRIEAYVMPGN